MIVEAVIIAVGMVVSAVALSESLGTIEHRSRVCWNENLRLIYNLIEKHLKDGK